MEYNLIIIIGTRNRKNILEKCVESLIGKISTNHKIIVIDAGSSDGTIEYLQKLDGLETIFDGKPIGQAQSYNRVLSKLDCNYFCWLSDDNVIQPGALDSAIKILDKHSKIGMVALKTKDVLGPFSDQPYIGGIYDTGILNCNQGVIRFDLLKKLGFFDEDFKNYGIDPDLTTKVLLSGYRVVYTKSVAIHHYRDHDSESGAISNSDRQKNLPTFQHKYHAKYSKLIDYGLFPKIQMKIKYFIWKRIKKHRKKLRKQGLNIDIIAGFKIKDWYNLSHCRYISIFDFFHNRNNDYYLEQRMPKSYQNNQ